MPSDRDFLAFREATGCTEEPDYISQSVLERYLPQLLEDQFRVRKDQGRKVLKALRKITKNAYEIACAVGCAVANSKCSVRYVEAILTNVSDGDHKESDETPTAKPPPKSIKIPPNDAVGFLTWKFVSQFCRNPKAGMECEECYGTGISVLWFGNPNLGIYAGKYGVCHKCLPGQGNPSGIGIVPDGFFAEMLDSGDPRFRDAEENFPEQKITAKRAQKNRPGSIYFIRGDSGRIKIGWAIDPKKRLKELQTGSCVKLELLLVIPGSVKDEKNLHSRFSSLRTVGEWFDPGDEIAAFIRDTKGGANGRISE